MIKLHQWIPRVAAGAFILNSGLTKRKVDQATAEHLHAQAAGTYEFLADWDAREFTKTLSTAEIALGAALIIPIVPTALVSVALGAFSGGLLGMYANTDGLHEPDSLRPTPMGTGVAKDVFLAGIAGGLFVDSVTRGKL